MRSMVRKSGSKGKAASALPQCCSLKLQESLKRLEEGSIFLLEKQKRCWDKVRLDVYMKKSHSLQLSSEARRGDCGKCLQIDNKIKTGSELRKVNRSFTGTEESAMYFHPFFFSGCLKCDRDNGAYTE